jgi:hypothetical protein
MHNLIQNIDRNIPIGLFGRNAGKLRLVESSFVNYPWKWKIILRSSKDIRGFIVTSVTSANTQDETLPQWSGFLQKDDGETQQ